MSGQQINFFFFFNEDEKGEKSLSATYSEAFQREDYLHHKQSKLSDGSVII